MQQKKLERICVYPKDIQIITGKSYRQSLRIYNQIKTLYNKQPHQVITWKELEEYLGVKIISN